MDKQELTTATMQHKVDSENFTQISHDHLDALYHRINFLNLHCNFADQSNYVSTEKEHTVIDVEIKGLI